VNLQTMLTVLFTLGGLLLVAATLPLALELLVLTVAALFPAPRRRDPAAEHEMPPLSVLIPAHNEEAFIERCVHSVLSCAGSGTEVLVVAHNCTDSTALRAERAGARLLVLNNPSQRGKGHALSHGFEVILAGPYQGVLVVDADSVVDDGLITEVRRRLRSGALAVQGRYEVYNCEHSQRTRLMTLAFYAANVIRPRGRARLGLSAGILGNGFAVHREVLARIPYSAHSVVEDLEYHLALVQAGIRVEFLHEFAVRGEMPVTAAAAKAQRARWEGGRFRMMRKWVPKLAADIFRGRATQIEPLLDLLALPMATEVLLLVAAACLPVSWLRIYVLSVFAVVLFHIGTAAMQGPGIGKTLRSLSTIPGYMLWKLWVLPEVWRTSRAGAAWVRTERESRADGRAM